LKRQTKAEIIRENNNKIIQLTVNPEQEYAVRLYKKLGFNEVGTAKNQYYLDDRYYDEVLMERYI